MSKEIYDLLSGERKRAVLQMQSFNNLISFGKVLPDLKAVWEKLNNHLCFWCRCRYLGVSDISFYKQPLNEAVKELRGGYPVLSDVLQNEALVPSYVCGGCFGVLTNFTDDVLLDQIEEEVSKQNVEFEHFCCSIALPVPSIVREYTYLLMCAEVSPEVYNYMPLDQIPTVKDVWKWVCGARLEKRFGKKFALEHLDILIDFDHIQLSTECNRLTESFRDQFKRRKGQITNKFTRNNVLNALLSVSRDKLRGLITYPPDRLQELCTTRSIVCSHNPVYVGGRYNKYSRELSQSPWIIEGQRKGLETSVSEILSQPLIDFTNSESHYFSSSGREDIDVQMLGNGRPFMIQLINPRKVLNQSIITNIQKEINKSNANLVHVRDLQIVSREATDTLKDLEAEKRKTYTALCSSDTDITQEELDKLADIKDLVLNQMTPIRVLHRRALATRPRTVHWMKAELQPDSHRLFTLTVETQGGTYVKEFVHSDFGRTVPNLATVLGKDQMDILSLDVLSVHVDWPPPLQVEENMSAE